MVRAASEADLSRIAEILVFGKRTAYRSIFQDDVGSFIELQVLPVAEEYRNGNRALSDVLVYDDGIVKGMLSRKFDQGEPGRALLDELYIDPFFTGLGIGHTLITAFLQEAVQKKQAFADLWVIESNPRARKLYASFGFSPTGKTQYVPGTSVTELLYRRPI